MVHITRKSRIKIANAVFTARENLCRLKIKMNQNNILVNIHKITIKDKISAQHIIYLLVMIKSKPIVVHFNNSDIKPKILYKMKKNKLECSDFDVKSEDPIYLNEHLMKETADLVLKKTTNVRNYGKVL